MLLTLIKALNTNDLKVIVDNLSLSPLDVDILLYKAQDDGEIAVDKKKNRLKVLKDEPVYYDKDLAYKLEFIVKRYDSLKANITEKRLRDNALNLPYGQYGVTAHDFACTLYALEEGIVPGIEKLNKYEISVPEIKDKRPFHTFIFYTFLDHQEYGAKAVNEFIDAWQKANVKSK